MTRLIRPSTTQSTAALWAKSVLNMILFLSFAMIGPLWLTHWLLPYRAALPSWARTIGSGVLFVVGFGVWAVCVDVFTRRGGGTPFPLDAPRHLVSTGPFAVVRNPIIVAEILVVWGAALYLSSLGALLYAAFFTFAGHCIVVYFEEPELRERFGKQYEDYCSRVPRWLPGLHTMAGGGATSGDSA